LRTVSLPESKIPTTIDRRYRLITDRGIQAAEFGLSHGEADERAYTVLPIKPPLVPLKNPP
jgi:hypothetical protein